jgi:hypothetical protein
MSSSKLILVISKSEHEQGWLDTSHPKFDGAIVTKIDGEQDDALSAVKQMDSNIYDEAYLQFLVPSKDLFLEINRVMKYGGKFLMEKCIEDRPAGQVMSTQLNETGFCDTMAAKDPITGDRFITCKKGNC